jgi:hypothetical protein
MQLLDHGSPDGMGERPVRRIETLAPMFNHYVEDTTLVRSRQHQSIPAQRGSVGLLVAGQAMP